MSEPERIRSVSKQDERERPFKGTRRDYPAAFHFRVAMTTICRSRPFSATFPPPRTRTSRADAGDETLDPVTFGSQRRRRRVARSVGRAAAAAAD